MIFGVIIDDWQIVVNCILQSISLILYLFWSSDDSKVAYLSNWLGTNEPTIARQVANIQGAAANDQHSGNTVDVNPIGVGRPFYFSWAPTGDRMIAHVGNREVLLLNVADQEAADQEAADQETNVLVEESANFAAPQWFAIADTVVEGQTASSMPAPGESGLLYVIRDENTAQLVLSDEAGDNEQFLTPLARQDFVSFSMNGTGRYIVAAGTFATWSQR